MNALRDISLQAKNSSKSREGGNSEGKRGGLFDRTPVNMRIKGCVASNVLSVCASYLDHDDIVCY